MARNSPMVFSFLIIFAFLIVFIYYFYISSANAPVHEVIIPNLDFGKNLESTTKTGPFTTALTKAFFETVSTAALIREVTTKKSFNYSISYFKKGQKIPSYPIFRRLQPELEPKNNSSLKTILLWTKLFKAPDWRLGGMGQEPFKRLKCPISNCYLTNDRSQLQSADAVLVHFRDDFNYAYKTFTNNRKFVYSHFSFLIRDRPNANQRKPNQLWTFVLWETPDHTYDWIWQSNRRHYRNLKEFKHFFNWTMTYRLDSDVRFDYGRFIPLEKPRFDRVAFDRLASKKRLAAWMTSHCDTASHREAYVRELKKYMEVDIIGQCKPSLPDVTRNICDRPTHFSGTKSACHQYLSNTYKFYLAFENSLCRDYVTEKLYRTAQMDTIPVVLNGANMSLFAPPHSYIDVDNFTSPKKLAVYLKKVGSDSQLYNSYFWWKPYYDVEQTWDGASYVKHFCDLCAKVNNAELFSPKSYADIDKWWTTDGNCYEGATSW